MGDMFEYLNWRGDLPFSQVPPTPVDALLLSTLVYIDFEGLVRPDLSHPVPLPVVSEAFYALPDQENRVRVRNDPRLLKAMATTRRFENAKLAFYRSQFIPEEVTQFAAMACLLDDGSAFLVYRGTDSTLVGWKEDFNMSFQDSVPAQREALAYLREFTAVSAAPLRLCGHSKGGNLAVFAAAKASPEIQNRIVSVYNNDGPGFTGYVLDDPGYQAIVPRIHTYIPESSIIGMLLEHREPYSVIKSTQVSILQHEPYSWEIMGGDFVHVEEISAGSRLMDQAIRGWIANMSRQEREDLVDTLFSLLSNSGADRTSDILQPKTIREMMKTLSADEKIRQYLTSNFKGLLRSAGDALNQEAGSPSKT